MSTEQLTFETFDQELDHYVSIILKPPKTQFRRSNDDSARQRVIDKVFELRGQNAMEVTETLCNLVIRDATPLLDEHKVYVLEKVTELDDLSAEERLIVIETITDRALRQRLDFDNLLKQAEKYGLKNAQQADLCYQHLVRHLFQDFDPKHRQHAIALHQTLWGSYSSLDERFGHYCDTLLDQHEDVFERSCEALEKLLPEADAATQKKAAEAFTFFLKTTKTSEDEESRKRRRDSKQERRIRCCERMVSLAVTVKQFDALIEVFKTTDAIPIPKICRSLTKHKEQLSESQLDALHYFLIGRVAVNEEDWAWAATCLIKLQFRVDQTLSHFIAVLDQIITGQHWNQKNHRAVAALVQGLLYLGDNGKKHILEILKNERKYHLLHPLILDQLKSIGVKAAFTLQVIGQMLKTHQRDNSAMALEVIAHLSGFAKEEKTRAQLVEFIAQGFASPYENVRIKADSALRDMELSDRQIGKLVRKHGLKRHPDPKT